MQRKFLLLLAALTVMVVLAVPQVLYGQMGPHRMGQPSGMMGNPGMGHGVDAQTIHQLFAYHDQIHRTVEEIPKGIRAVTESDNPEVAKLIQTHVSRMYDRVRKQQFVPMMGMSSTLPTMIQANNQYQREFRITPKGIEVKETSNNPEMVVVIREHAKEVTQFAAQGMPAMMGGRMR